LHSPAPGLRPVQGKYVSTLRIFYNIFQLGFF